MLNFAQKYLQIFCIMQNSITTRLYLDTRATGPGEEAPLKLSICLHGKSALIPLGLKILPEYWDRASRTVVRHPRKQELNIAIQRRKNEIDMTVLRLVERGIAKGARSVTDMKKMIIRHLEDGGMSESGAFLERFRNFAETRRTEGSRVTYRQTIKKMTAFDPDIELRTFEDIDHRWLRDFESFMERTSRSANGRGMYFRCIRAVFNDAIDDGITSAYPFRKFKIRKEPTRKRSLTVDQLRVLMSYPVEEHQRQYRDMFILMFYLIGINAVDLFNARPDALCNGRLEYIRAKTHKAYSVKVEPEAMAIIDRYRGKDWLLNIMDSHSNYKDYLHRMGDELKRIGPFVRSGRGGKKIYSPLFPDISQYWCRHTWATIAAELDIPKETIAAGLGHDMGNPTTAIYIDFDRRKVDEANRRIIDYVLYDRR